ncbi:unnamed protein product [Rhizoctonia solani]|uniref:Uncharacterized protein n=1 Tax=Rhizoctonia solani TaxID=456999 RepID=A0A8H3C6X1_9AGAM|nr:unnamed protein product [Rhizoctonia solani]
MADTSKSRPNSYILLEDLWQEIYRSLQRQGYAFWERTIAEHTKGLARELIYRLARSKILQLFGDNGESINGLSVAASTVARIEALAEKRELIDPTVWDKAWDMHWEEAWKQHGPVVQPRNPGGIQTFASLSGGINTTTAIADGRSSGRAAGRAPVMSSPTGSSGILLNAILVGAHSQPLGGPTHSTMEAGAQGDGSQSPNHITSNRRDTLANSEVLASNVHHASITKKYDCTVNWLGSSCLLSDSNTYKIWTTPQECAIESAWGVAWSVGELYGRDEASSILKKDDEPVDQPQTQPATTGVRLRARTLSKAVTGIVTRASQRFSILLNGEHGQESPVTVVPTIDGSAEANRGTASSQPSLTTAAPSLGAGPSAIKNLRVSTLTNMISDRQTDSPLPMSPQPGGNRLSPLVTRVRKISGASSRLRTPITPTAGLDPISEASTSRIDLSATSPAAGITGAASQLFPVTSPVQATSPQSPDSSIPPSGIATPRPRSESTKRLRKHIITRWSNPEPYSDFEASFRDKNQERKYRENKESSCKKATQRIPLDLLRTKLQEVDPAKQAAEAWDRANSISSKVPFQQKLKALAQQEWETMVIQNGSTSFTAASESNWKNGFISAWERTWKESWAAAWTAVWKLSFREAISRGIEFGVDDVFDLDSKLRRKTYDQLVSSDPYKELQELLNNTSSLETLEQIHQWMKELGYLSELLQHSVPTLRDEYVEITVESKVTCDDQ